MPWKEHVAKQTDRTTCTTVVIDRIESLPLVVILALWFIGFGARIPPAYATTPCPTLRLFPTTVVENIKETSETAMTMEQNLHGAIETLERQMKLYRASQCDGADADQGCAELRRQMGATYLELLARIEQRLPEMERSVRATNQSLERRLRGELGRRLTPRDIQRLLGKQHGRPLVPGKSVASRWGGRLSEKFRQYQRLVAMGSRGGNGSLAAVAAAIYLDTREVSDLIARTRDEISRARLIIELDRTYGLITPEMFATVSGIKQILFGEADEMGGYSAGPPPRPKVRQYQSPLDLS